MKRINITMEDFLLEELDYMARKRGISRSALLAYMVSDEFMNMTRNGDIGEDYYKQQCHDSYEQITMEV